MIRDPVICKFGHILINQVIYLRSIQVLLLQKGTLMKKMMSLLCTMICMNSLLHSESDRWESVINHHSQVPNNPAPEITPSIIPNYTKQEKNPVQQNNAALLAHNFAQFTQLAKDHSALSPAELVSWAAVPAESLIGILCIAYGSPNTQKIGAHLSIVAVLHYGGNWIYDYLKTNSACTSAQTLLQTTPGLQEKIKATGDAKLVYFLQTVACGKDFGQPAVFFTNYKQASINVW